MEENWTLALWGRALPRSRRFQVGGSQARRWALATHDPGARRLPGRQAGRNGRRLSARRCQGSGVDRPAGQDDEVNQGTVPPRGNRQANLAWLSLVRAWFHRTRPDQTLGSRRQRRQRTQREVLPKVLKSGPSAVRTPRICELLHIFGLVLSALRVS